MKIFAVIPYLDYNHSLKLIERGRMAKFRNRNCLFSELTGDDECFRPVSGPDAQTANNCCYANAQEVGKTKGVSPLKEIIEASGEGMVETEKGQERDPRIIGIREAITSLIRR